MAFFYHNGNDVTRREFKGVPLCPVVDVVVKGFRFSGQGHFFTTTPQKKRGINGNFGHGLRGLHGISRIFLKNPRAYTIRQPEYLQSFDTAQDNA
jgi:hypothetical protein